MEKTALAAPNRRPVIPAADATAVACEQLAWLALHVADGFCVAEEDCMDCALLLAAREILLDRFKVSEKPERVLKAFNRPRDVEKSAA